MKRLLNLLSAAVLALLWLVCVSSEPPRLVFSLVISVLLHEAGHVIAIRLARLPLRGVLLLPFGAMLDTGTRLCSYPAECAVYLSGPMASFICAAVAAFGADAEVGNVAFYVEMLSLGLGCFNLIPLPGLDGAGALRSLLLYFMPDMCAAERAARVVEAVLALLFWLVCGTLWLAFDVGAYPLLLSVFFLLRIFADKRG